MPLDRSQLNLPSMPQEEVPVEGLGGDVIVRGMLLSERIANTNVRKAESTPRAGEAEQDAHARAGAGAVPRVLSMCVVDVAGKSLMSAAEWDVFGATHSTDAFRLFNVAMRLSGQDTADVEKN